MAEIEMLAPPTLQAPMIVDNVKEWNGLKPNDFVPKETFEPARPETAHTPKMEAMRRMLDRLSQQRGLSVQAEKPTVELTSSSGEKERLSKLRSKSTQTMFLKLAELHESGDLSQEMLQHEVEAMAQLMARDASEKTGIESKVIAQYLKEAAVAEVGMMELTGEESTWGMKANSFSDQEKEKIREQHVGYVVGQLADESVLGLDFSQNLQVRSILEKILTDHLAQKSTSASSEVANKAWDEMKEKLQMQVADEAKISAVKKILEQLTGYFDGGDTSYMLNQAGRIAGLTTIKFATEVLQMSDEDVRKALQMPLEQRKDCVLSPTKFGKAGQLIYMATTLGKLTWNVSKINQGLMNPNKEKGIAKFSPKKDLNPNQYTYIDTLEGMIRAETQQKSLETAALAAAKDTDQVVSTLVAEGKFEAAV